MKKLNKLKLEETTQHTKKVIKMLHRIINNPVLFKFLKSQNYKLDRSKGKKKIRA